MTFVDSIPDGLDAVWQLAVDTLAPAATLVVAAALVRRRFAVLRDLVLAAVVAVAAAFVLARGVSGDWPRTGDALRTLGPAVYPSLRLALTAAVVVAAISASVVHLALGSCRGRPGLEDVAAALEGLGVRADSLGAADRQRDGLFLVDARDDGGRALVVKVYEAGSPSSPRCPSTSTSTPARPRASSRSWPSWSPSGWPQRWCCCWPYPGGARSSWAGSGGCPWRRSAPCAVCAPCAVWPCSSTAAWPARCCSPWPWGAFARALGYPSGSTRSSW